MLSGTILGFLIFNFYITLTHVIHIVDSDTLLCLMEFARAGIALGELFPPQSCCSTHLLRM